MSECAFCDIDSNRVIQETALFAVIRDLFPVTHLHTLIFRRTWLPLTTAADKVRADMRLLIMGILSVCVMRDYRSIFLERASSSFPTLPSVALLAVAAK